MFLLFLPLDGLGRLLTLRYTLIALILLFFQFLLFAINLLINEIETISFIKYYYYIRVIPFLIMLLVLRKNYPGVMKKVLDFIFYISVFSLVINSLYMMRQARGVHNMDDVDGFFGSAATHSLSFCWLIFLGFLRYRKKYSFGIILPVILYMLFLSILAESKTFIAFVFIYIIIVVFQKKMSLMSKVFFIIFTTVVVSIASVTAYLTVPDITTYVDNNLLKWGLNQYMRSNDDEATGSEREAMIRTSVSDPNAFLFGNGIGCVSEAFGFQGYKRWRENVHFGMIDMSAIIYEGGILFYLILISLMAVLLDNFFPGVSYWRLFLIFFFLNVLFWYSKILSDPREMVASVFIFIVYGHYLEESPSSGEQKK